VVFAPVVVDLLSKRPSHALLDVLLRVKGVFRRPDDLHPPLEWQRLAVGLIDLEP
jgi:hypothetical protein